MTPVSKTCARCGEDKSIEKFGYRSNTKDHLSSCCRQCLAASGRDRWRETQARHYEEKYQHLLTQKSHPGYIFRSRDSERHGQHCRTVLLTRYGQTVVEFDDGFRMPVRQFQLRRAKEN